MVHRFKGVVVTLVVFKKGNREIMENGMGALHGLGRFGTMGGESM